MSDEVTISKELLNQLINIANPSMPNGVDIVNGAILAARGPLPATCDYYVLYRVTWQPQKAGDEGPMDRAHFLRVDDERYLTHEMVELGELHFIAKAVQRESSAEPEPGAMIFAYNIVQRARLIAGMDHVTLAHAGLNLTELDFQIESVATALARQGLVANEGLFEPSEEPASTNP